MRRSSVINDCFRLSLSLCLSAIQMQQHIDSPWRHHFKTIIAMFYMQLLLLVLLQSQWREEDQRATSNLSFHLDIPLSNSIGCYQCTDCPEPFTENYPYVTLINNTNYRAECTVSLFIPVVGDSSLVVDRKPWWISATVVDWSRKVRSIRVHHRRRWATCRSSAVVEICAIPAGVCVRRFSC